MSNQQATYGIIGYPIEHSLSPVMHNAAFKELHVDAVYKTFSLKADELDGFFKELRRKDNPIFGLNVTIPHKEHVLSYLDTVAPLAHKIGAVNTIVINKDRKLVGYNTDAPGFITHLAELKFDTTDKKIAILGAGGSARAILTALCLIPERPESIKLYNRTSSRSENLVADLSERMDTSILHCVTSIDDLNIELADLLINTTSIGLKKDDEVLIDEHMLHHDMLVYDLIYNPKETALLKMAKRKGAKTANGLGMLYYQGVLAFEHWAGNRIDDKVKKKMREALERAI